MMGAYLNLYGIVPLETFCSDLNFRGLRSVSSSRYSWPQRKILKIHDYFLRGGSQIDFLTESVIVTVGDGGLSLMTY